MVHNGRVEQAAVDRVAADAVELARNAAVEVGADQVGDHLGVVADAEGLVTHAFAAGHPGYVGWYWAVTLAHLDGESVTVDEVVLLPGADALLAPEWVPWSERIRPGDLSPGDLVPTAPDDPRLVPGYTLSDDPAVEDVAFELGLGRVRVPSRFGRLDAAERWEAGETGPDTPMARQAPAHCGTCGFFLPLAGSLRAAFGACSNELAGADGRVVSVEHGCGAHSEVVVDVVSLAEPVGAVYDDGEQITVNEPSAEAETPVETGETAETRVETAEAAEAPEEEPSEELPGGLEDDVREPDGGEVAEGEVGRTDPVGDVAEGEPEVGVGDPA
jgi:hypothetical protein